MNGVFDDYILELTMEAKLPIEGDESDYINTINGEILYYNKRSGAFENCGRLICHFINLEQVFNDNAGYFQILDAHSGDLFEITSLFNPKWSYETKHLKRTTVKALKMDEDELLWGSDNFIHIDRLEIIYKHRGKGVGIHFLREALVYLSKVFRFSYFVMQPCPLQCLIEDSEKKSRTDEWKRKMRFDKLEQDRPKAMKKLRSLYAGLGFTLVKGTQLMVCRSANFYE